MCAVRWDGDASCLVMVEDRGAGSGATRQGACVCEREAKGRNLRSLPVLSCGGQWSAVGLLLCLVLPCLE